MCGTTCWHRSFLFHLHMFQASKQLGISDPPALMMEEMGSTMASVGGGVVVSDSLYMTQHSAVFWGELTKAFPQARFLTSVHPRSFQPILSLVKPEAYQTPGQYVILWNEEHHQ